MKARILFMFHSFLVLLIAFFGIVNAETVHITKNFDKKEVVELQTADVKTQDHELFEYYLYSMFEDVPYLQIVPTYDETLKDVKFETFVPNFQAMEEKGHNYMIFYTIEKNSYENSISYTVFDGLYQKTLFSGAYKTKENIETIAKNIANEVYLAITGEFGFFVGKLFYTERSKTTGFQVLYSQDLNLKKTAYTSENSMITSPSYCQNGARIFFASKNSEEMYIYQMSAETGTAKKMQITTKETPYLLAPEVSKDCNKLFISSLHEDGSEILMYSMENKTITSIISDEHINTSPIFDEDANQIYYISNKILPTKIWTTFLDGSKTKYLVSRGLGGYIYLSLSPDRTKIAFVKILNGKFYLGIMDKDGANEMLLKTGYIIEEPSWAPYGNNIIVSIQDEKRGPRTIYSVSSKTGYSYPLKLIKGNIVQANWLIGANDLIPQTYYH